MTGVTSLVADGEYNSPVVDEAMARASVLN